MATDDVSDALVDESVHRLLALGGGPQMARLAAARLLARLTPARAAALLQAVIERARRGDAESSAALPAFTQALDREAASIPHVASLRRLALANAHDDAAALFTWGEPSQALAPEAAKRADAKLFTNTLGHMKTQARLTTNPDQLARLATASDPAVIRNVLLNPRLTEALVVRIAARRPARPEPLLEIWRSPRWAARPAVRKALVFNPYFPPEVAARIVPLLTRADLLELRRDHGLPEALRAQAEHLLSGDR